MQYHDSSNSGIILSPGIERTTKEELDFGNYNLFEDEKGTFGTLNSKFDRTKFDRLTKLMEFNVLNNVEMIRSVLRQVVKVRSHAGGSKHSAEGWSPWRKSPCRSGGSGGVWGSGRVGGGSGRVGGGLAGWGVWVGGGRLHSKV